MSLLSSRLSLIFSCIGHMYSHVWAPIFFIAVLTLEGEWGLTHGEAVALIVIGNVLFGVAAPFAGWLGDRWSSVGMMSIFFVGTGGGLVGVGVAETPMQAVIALTFTGMFASIYHPVGISWLVRNAERRGAALGVNGIFGGIGPAVAAVSAGLLIDYSGWRAAFIVPGLVMLATAAVFQFTIVKGWIVETRTDRRTDPPASGNDRIRAFAVLAVTMLCTGFIYQATQSGLPKVFSERLTMGEGETLLGIASVVALVYLVAGLMQLAAGLMADRFPLKAIYLGTFMFQIPLLLAAGAWSGTALVVAAMAMVSVNVGSLPAENALIARYAPSRWRGLVFGLKFVLAFGVSGLGVKLEGSVYDITGGFWWLFVTLAAIAAIGATAGLMLPSEKRRPIPAPAE